MNASKKVLQMIRKYEKNQKAGAPELILQDLRGLILWHFARIRKYEDRKKIHKKVLETISSPTLRVIPISYFCPTCDRKHVLSSKTGREHLPPMGTTITVFAEVVF
jgi:hypothetical protein